jgi:hypothetical protein
MGLKFDRILNGFDGPFNSINYGQLQTPEGSIKESAGSAGYIISSASNGAFTAVNNLIKEGVKVSRLGSDASGGNTPRSFYVPASSKNKILLQKYSKELGINVTGVKSGPSGSTPVTPLRIALWDTYGGSMSSGWTRWLLEQYNFPFKLIYTKEIDGGDLKKNYDVIVFVSGAIPAAGKPLGRNLQPKADSIPAEYRQTLGRITPDTSISHLKKFLHAGGRIVTIGSSTELTYHLGLPVQNALTEMNNNQERPLPKEKFYIPGSIIRATVDTTAIAASGLPSTVDVYFDESPVFKIAPDAIAKGNVKPLVWYASDKTLRSGWAWGQSYLKNGVAAFEAPFGAGKLVAFGPEITFRAQTHGTFKFLFNQLYK